MMGIRIGDGPEIGCVKSLSCSRQPLSSIYYYGHTKPPEINMEVKVDPNLPDDHWFLDGRAICKEYARQRREEQEEREAIAKLTKAAWAYHAKYGRWPSVEFDESTNTVRLAPHKD